MPRAGPREPPPDRAEAVEERRTRALESPLDVRVRPDPRFLWLEVRNPVHQTHYDVLLPAFPGREHGMCTCPDFARRGFGTCKHLEAAWLWLQERPETPSFRAVEEASERAVWEEIDRRLKGAREGGWPSPQSVRYAGEALWTVREARKDPVRRGPRRGTNPNRSAPADRGKRLDAGAARGA